eukprot:TRINITY_DN8361_c0_g1_i2.p1 TRINITY_DN8361_c0_g1~~TRINITY_DN8361_c0_g1_i2.p1  ORF type:complete len:206 (-),score=36.10 TRINITY_DN8361_c0_g1_i2:451-1020(-)
MLRCLSHHSTKHFARNISCSAFVLHNPSGFPSPIYHRHSTRYQFTDRAVLERLEQEFRPDQPHREPKNAVDRLAYGVVSTLWKGEHWYFGRKWLQCAVVLETMASIPGLVTAIWHHLRSLRRLQVCHWVKPLQDEAENERMHLMSIMAVANPTSFQKLMLPIVQVGFFFPYFFCIHVCPTAVSPHCWLH